MKVVIYGERASFFLSYSKAFFDTYLRGEHTSKGFYENIREIRIYIKK